MFVLRMKNHPRFLVLAYARPRNDRAEISWSLLLSRNDKRRAPFIEQNQYSERLFTCQVRKFL